MKLPRRQFLQLAGGTAAVSALPRAACALDYPTRRCRSSSTFAAGLAPDVAARLIGPPLSQRLGQPLLIEDRPGAGGNIGAEVVVRAPPDGYTLLLIISGNAASAALYQHLTFDFVRDIAAVAFVGYTPFAMAVAPSFPAKTVPEFIAYAKAHPGTINFASAGVGHRAASCRRIVQDADRRQHRACTVSHELHARPARRTGPGRIRRTRPELSATSAAASCARSR